MFQDIIIITKRIVHIHRIEFSFNKFYIPEAGLAALDHPASTMELFETIAQRAPS